MDDALKFEVDFAKIDAACARVVQSFGEMVLKGISAFQGVEKAAMKMIGSFDKIATSGLKAFTNISTQALKSLDTIASMSLKVVERFSVQSLKAFSKITDVGIKVLERMAVNGMKSFSKISDAAFSIMTKGVIDAMKSMVSTSVGSFETIKKAARAAWASVTGGLSMIPGVISRVFSLVTSPIRAVFGGIITAAKSVVSGVVGIFSRISDAVRSTLSGAFDVVKSLLPLVGIGLFAGIAHGLVELKATEEAFTRMSSAIKITGGIAGVTEKELSDLADEMERTTRYGDDLVLSAEAIGLQFKNVRGDNFINALKLSADMAARLGWDLETAAERMFRALDQPGEKLLSLEKAGEVFTDTEKEMISEMAQAGNVAEAQAIILERLRQSFGGAAAEDVKTFSGMIAQVNNAMGDAWKTIAQALTPALKVVADYFHAGAKQIESWGPALERTVNWIMEWAASTQGVIQEWIDWGKDEFGKWSDYILDKVGVVAAFLAVAIPNAMELIKVAMKEPGTVFEWVKAEGLLAFEGIKNSAMDIFDQIAQKIKTVWTAIVEFMTDNFADAIDTMFTNFEKRLVTNLTPGLKKFYQSIGMELESEESMDERLQGRKDARKGERRLRDTFRGLSKEEQDKMVNKGVISRDEAEKFVPSRGEDRRDKEQEATLESRRKKLLELQETVEEARKKMGEAGNFQAPDIAGWQAKMDEFKAKVKEFFGVEEEATGGDGKKKKKSTDPYNIKKDGDSVGGFEGLLELQKRIAGAAGGRRPIEATMSDLLKVTKEKKSADAEAQKKQEVAMEKTKMGSDAQVELLAMAKRGELFGPARMGA